MGGAWEQGYIGNLHPSVAVFYCLCLVLISAAVPPDQQCKLTGCTRPRYVEPGGRVHDFCGRTHANQYATQQNPSKLTPRPLVPGMLDVQNFFHKVLVIAKLLHTKRKISVSSIWYCFPVACPMYAKLCPFNIYFLLKFQLNKNAKAFRFTVHIGKTQTSV